MSLDPVEGRAAELEVTPAAPRDTPSVDARGRRLDVGIEGVELVRLGPFQVDHRGSLLELIDLRDPFWDEPIVYGYRFTIRPGRIKGWGMHKLQTDRYLVLDGLLRVVLYDGRVGSPSHERVAELYFSPETPGLLKIPPGVWHADQNLADREVAVVNLPTRPYEHSNPDKYRIEPESGVIPFDWTLRNG